MHFTHGDTEQARKQFLEFEKQWEALDDDARAADPAIVEQRAKLASALFPTETAAAMLISPKQRDAKQKQAQSQQHGRKTQHHQQ